MEVHSFPISNQQNKRERLPGKRKTLNDFVSIKIKLLNIAAVQKHWKNDRNRLTKDLDVIWERCWTMQQRKLDHTFELKENSHLGITKRTAQVWKTPVTNNGKRSISWKFLAIFSLIMDTFNCPILFKEGSNRSFLQLYTTDYKKYRIH